MKHSLLKSFIFCWFFWWTVAFLFTPYNAGSMALLPSLIVGFSFFLIAIFVGAVTMIVIERVKLEKLREDTAPTKSNGLFVAIGTMPIFSKPARSDSFTIPSDLVDWYKRYKGMHPDYAALFDAVLMMYEAKPVPASPIKGGHGGLNLRDHSFNVLREILAAKDTFVFEGSKTKDGKIRQSLNDSSYKFDSKDPAIPFLGFAHDLGKLVCYKPLPNGLVEEVRLNHDIRGSRLLVAIPEFIALTANNQDLRNSLSVIMAYYHHPVEMPLWASDHTRALTELLIVADNSASDKEGGAVMDYTSSSGDVIEINENTGALEALAEQSNGEFNLNEVSAPDPVDTSSDVVDETPLSELPPETLPVPAAPIASPVVRVEQQAPSLTKSKSAPKYERKRTPPVGNGLTPGFRENDVEAKTLSLGKTIFEELIKILVKSPDLLGDKAGSIGFIKDKFYYIHDLSLRELLLKKFKDGKLTVHGKNNVQNPYSYALLAYLMHNDWLYCQHNGKNYSSKRAMFTINKIKVSDGRKIVEKTMTYMIVINEEAFINRGIPYVKGTRLNVEITKATGGNDFKLNEIDGGDDDAEEDVLSDEDLSGMAIALSAENENKNSEQPDGIDEQNENMSAERASKTEPFISSESITLKPAAKHDLLDDVMDLNSLESNDDNPVTEVDSPIPSAEINSSDAEMSSSEIKATQDESDDDESDAESDEPSYVNADERFGVMKVIAKLQYKNNNSLRPIAGYRSPSATNYLLYDLKEVCLKFRYSQSELESDTKDYCLQNQSKRIGIKLHTVKNKELAVFFVKMADENEVEIE